MKFSKKLTAYCFALIMTVSSFALYAKADFVTTDKGTKYENKDGDFVTSKLITINDKKYYFDSNGYMKTGWFKSNKGTYYFDENGVMQTGLQKIDDKYYYFASSGVMSTGTIKTGKNIYKFAKDGHMTEKVNGFVKLKSGTYYCVKGKIQTGLIDVTGSDGGTNYYYFDKDGKMVTGKKVDYKLYTLYIDKNGMIYDIKDNSDDVIDDYEKLLELKSDYEYYIKTDEDKLNDLKKLKSEIQQSLNDAKQKLQNAKNKKRRVYGSGGGVSYAADPDAVANAQYIVDSWQDTYDECVDAIKVVENRIKTNKNELKKRESKINELKAKLKEAGYNV